MIKSKETKSLNKIEKSNIMEKSKKYYFISVISFIVFIVFTLLVKYVDVQAIGPQGSSVGFATLNGAVAAKLPYNDLMYSISEVLGYLGMSTCLIFGLFGVMQLVIKKGIKKIDKDIIALGVFYVAVLCTYVIFEKVVINYRPIILEQELEASYPSSHTMLAVSFLVVAIRQFSARLKTSKTRMIVLICCVADMLGIIVCRLSSGVHWLTDILGAIFIALAWAMLYCGVFETIMDKKEKKEK